MPFYYLEYGIAQLGAIGIWRNYKLNPVKAIKQYEQALSEGYSFTLPELYLHAGVQFNFSEDYVKELIDFVSLETEKIKN